MYIRFAQERRDPDCRVASGIFHALNRLPPLDPSDWRHSEIDHLREWFWYNLLVPDRLERRIGRQGLRQGVCWFHAHARTHVSQARYLAWLLGEFGIPLRELRSDRKPGQLIYSDSHQIVAVPTPDLCPRLR